MKRQTRVNAENIHGMRERGEAATGANDLIRKKSCILGGEFCFNKSAYICFGS